MMEKIIVIGIPDSGSGGSVLLADFIADAGTDVELITVQEAAQRGIIVPVEQIKLTIELKNSPEIYYPKVIASEKVSSRKKEREQWKHRKKHFRK